MKPTERQRLALRKLNAYDNVLLYGGARSGKTFITVSWILYRALKFDGSRQIITRRYATDVRMSVWRDTLAKAAAALDLHPGIDFTANEVGMEYRFPNGSMILCAGLDDKERTDKILGQEYATIYVNESQDVPWPTVKTLKTRLSQKIDGMPNRFVADLNPASVAHWTYKLFIDRRDPETGTQRSDSIGVVQLNPYDNRQNLADGYIEHELETLTGDFRSRFLLGEYCTNTELSVFAPVSLYQWPDFGAWVNGRWPSVRLVGGLDLGIDDPDAFAILAYIDGDPDVWLVYEHMARRQGIDELATEIKRGMAWARDNIPTPEPNMEIWSDTNTIRHGKEGDAKKNARMLSEIYGLPTRPAYKRDKMLGIEFLRDDVNAGRLHIPAGGVFADECIKTVWTKNKVDGAIIREIDDEVFHPNMMDAILYPYRFLMSYGNSAMIGRASGVKAESASEMDKMVAALNQPDKYW